MGKDKKTSNRSYKAKRGPKPKSLVDKMSRNLQDLFVVDTMLACLKRQDFKALWKSSEFSIDAFFTDLNAEDVKHDDIWISLSSHEKRILGSYICIEILKDVPYFKELREAGLSLDIDVPLLLLSILQLEKTVAYYDMICILLDNASSTHPDPLIYGYLGQIERSTKRHRKLRSMKSRVPRNVIGSDEKNILLKELKNRGYSLNNGYLLNKTRLKRMTMKLSSLLRTLRHEFDKHKDLDDGLKCRRKMLKTILQYRLSLDASLNKNDLYKMPTSIKRY